MVCNHQESAIVSPLFCCCRYDLLTLKGGDGVEILGTSVISKARSINLQGKQVKISANCIQFDAKDTIVLNAKTIKIRGEYDCENNRRYVETILKGRAQDKENGTNNEQGKKEMYIIV